MHFIEANVSVFFLLFPVGQECKAFFTRLAVTMVKTMTLFTKH